MNVNVVAKFAGLIKIETIECDEQGHIIYDEIQLGLFELRRNLRADWFPNLILTQGLNRIGVAGDYINACQVGTSSTAPTIAQSGLVGFVAGTSTIQATNNATQGGVPYYGYRNKTYRFSVGAAQGNLAEVGIGWATTGAALFSRALILDGIGDPTVITVLATEILDVSYQLRLYPELVDVVSSITISTISHNYTLRASEVTNNGLWGARIGERPAWFTSTGAIVYSGAIGLITAGPTGSGDSDGGPTERAYVNLSNERLLDCTFGLNDGNFGGGIAAMQMRTYGLGSYQMDFSPAILKNNTNTLDLTFKISWAAKILP